MHTSSRLRGSPSLRHRPRRWGLRVAAILALLATAVTAHAQEFWKIEPLLKSFFPNMGIKYTPVTLSDADAAQIAKTLGVKDVSRKWSIYYGHVDGKRQTGFALIDHEKGLHEPIDFAVQFSEKGVVERIEIMVYREAYGSEVRRESFRKQFVGKSARDKLVAGQDIDIISGATYSSKSIALGVKRDALVLQAALKNGL